MQQVLQSIEVEIKTNNISHLCNKLYFLLRIICLHVVAETKPLIGFINQIILAQVHVPVKDYDCTLTNFIITSYRVKADLHLIDQ